MRPSDIRRPRGLEYLASALLELDFPESGDRVRERVGHIMLEDRRGELVSAASVLDQKPHDAFESAHDVIVTVSEALGIGLLETDLGEIGPPEQATWSGESDRQAAAAGRHQLIDEVDRDDGLARQAIEADADAANAEAREQMRARQRDERYNPPDGPEDNPALDHTHPSLLDAPRKRAPRTDR